MPAAPNYTVADVQSLVRDYLNNQVFDSTTIIRHLNVAADMLFTSLGHPSLEKHTLFNYDQAQLAYSMPADFGEPIFLKYVDDTLNDNQRFSYRPSELLYERVENASTATRLMSFDTKDNIWRLLVIAQNSKAQILVDSFDYDNATNWTPSNDATNITDDSNVYEEGAGSLSFDVNVALSGSNRATITRSLTAQDWSQYVNYGQFKISHYIPNVTNLTSVSYSWQSSAGNYYKSTVTAQADGTAFAVGWNQLLFDWATATVVGSPDSTAIVTIWLDLDYTGAYTGGSSYRFDYLYLIWPDQMDLVYYTRIKGTSSTGTALYDFTVSTDKFTFGYQDSQIKNVLAMQTAIMISPQILQGNEWMKEQLGEMTIALRRRFPRKRMINLIMEPQLPNTD